MRVTTRKLAHGLPLVKKKLPQLLHCIRFATDKNLVISEFRLAI